MAKSVATQTRLSYLVVSETEGESDDNDVESIRITDPMPVKRSIPIKCMFRRLLETIRDPEWQKDAIAAVLWFVLVCWLMLTQIFNKF
tara:strand:+ start:2391 stop:2654 length:264 start_codon:yes stop_codon:yes gene_type:complete